MNQMTKLKPLSLSAQCKVWIAWNAEIRPVDGCPWMCDLIEPLHVDYPASAKPYCWGVGQIDFYDRTGNVKLGSTSSHHLTSTHPQLLFINGCYWEVFTCGEVVCDCGQWIIKRRLRNDTRLANLLNGTTMEAK